MPLRSDWSSATCPIAHAADLLADPWVLLVLRELFSGRTRFDELRSATGAADSVLSRRLGAMRDAGLITREGRAGYRLSETGRATLPILHAYARFTQLVDPDGPWGLTMTCARCENELPSADWCPTCAAPCDADSTRWARRSMDGGAFALADAAGPSAASDAASAGAER